MLLSPFSDLSGVTGDGSPLLCTVHPATSKLVVASGRRMGARGALSGAVLLNGILQCPAKKNSDVVSIEIPFIQVGITSHFLLEYPLCWG